MTDPNTIQSTVITTASSIVHDDTTYTFNINHLITPHAINDYTVVVFPS